MERVGQFTQKITLVLLTVFSGFSWGQFDLTVNPVASPYQFTGDGAVNSVGIQVNNSGPGVAVDGIQLNVDLAQTLLSFQGNFIAAPWECNLVATQSMECFYQANLNPASSTIVNIPVLSQPGDFNLAPAMSFSVIDIGGSETNTGNNDGTLDIVYTNGGPEIRVRKAVWDGSTNSGPVTALPQGGIAEYLLYLDNTGGTAANNVDFSDVLPAGVTFNPSLNAGNNPEYYNDMIGSCTLTAGVLNCSVPSIAAGTANNLVKVFADVTGNPGDFVTNIADTMFADGNPSNNSDSASFTITAAPVQVDMEVGIFFAQSSYNVSDVIPVSLEVTNNTLANDADFVTAVITLPDEVVFQSVQPPTEFTCTHDGSGIGGDITCITDANAISGGNDVTIDFDVVAALATNTADFSATVSRPESDTDTSNNTDNGSLIIFGGPNDFIIQKTPSATNVNLGDTFSYQITVQHNVTPGSDAYDLVIQDTLPSELSYQGFSQTSSGVAFQCNHDGLANGGLLECHTAGAPFTFSDSLDMTIMVEAVSDGVVSNTATVYSASDADGSGGNNTSTAAAVNVSIPFTNVTLAKQAVISGNVVTEVPLGTDFLYQLNVTNSGAFNVMDMDVVDLLPSDVTLLNYSGGADWNCSDTLVGGQTQVSCSFIGDMLVAASSTIDINVTATSDTSVTSVTNQMDVSALNLTATQTAQNTVNLSNPSLGVSMTQAPNPADAGQQFEYVIELTNDGTQSLTNVNLDSVLPQDITFSSFTSTSGNCSHNSGTVSCAIGTMAVSDVVGISVFATAPNNPDPNNSYINQVSVTSPDLPLAVTAQLATAISPPPFSDYVLNFYPTNLVSRPNQNANVEFSIQNTGTVALNPIAFQMNLDPAFVPQSVNSTEFNCLITGQTVSCNNNTALPTANTFQGHVVVTAGPTEGTYQHQISAQANGVNKTSQTTHYIIDNTNNNPDIDLTKTASLSEVSTNTSFDYFFNVSNTGQGGAQNITLIDTLPTGVKFDGYVGQGWQCQGSQNINCQYTGDLQPNTSAPELKIGVSSPSVAGVVVNTATVNADNEINTSNNSDSISVEVLDINVLNSDLSVTKTVSHDQITAGDALDWTITVGNQGPDEALQVQLNDTFPVGFVADAIMQSDGLTCMLLTDSLTCEQDSLIVGGSVQVVLTGHVDMNYEGDMLNVATVNSLNIDDNSSNNQSMAQLQVLPYHQTEADLSIQVSANQSQILQGDTFQMSVEAKNSGPDVAEQASISIQLSGLIEQVNTLNVGSWQCQNTQSNISCQLPVGMPNSTSHELTFEVKSEQVVQTAQPIQIAAEINAITQDPNASNNQAVFTTDVTPTPTEEEILNHMEGVMGSMDEQTERAIRNVSSYCARRYFMALEGLCSAMYNTTQEDHDDMHDMMREITPNEVLAQSSSASEIVSSQFANVDSRLAELRGGGGGFSVAGLRGTYGNESIPLGMLAYLNAGEDDNTANAVNDFVSPWGFFINGTISMGERDKTGRELGFDFDTFGITAGLDYRLSNKKVVGVALGYANFDSEIEDEAEMQSDGVTLTGYGSFYINDNFYVDTRISYGKPNFDQSRRINFSLDDIAIDRVAKGETSANQYSASMSMGYHFYKNAWNITPNANISYINTSISSFQETGAGGFNFEYAQQDIKSLKASLGLSVSRAISLEKGVITPQFDINMSREMENDGGLIEARFISAPDDEIFWIETDEPDRTFGNAGLGLVFIGANGKQAYINYRSIFGLEGFSRGTINLGLRFEF